MILILLDQDRVETSRSEGDNEVLVGPVTSASNVS